MVADVKSTTPKRYKTATIMATIVKIDAKRGMWNLSSTFTMGNSTKDSNMAITKGNTTVDAILKTPIPTIQQMKSIA